MDARLTLKLHFSKRCVVCCALLSNKTRAWGEMAEKTRNTQSMDELITVQFFPPYRINREIEILQNGKYTVDLEGFRPLEPSSLTLPPPNSPQYSSPNRIAGHCILGGRPPHKKVCISKWRHVRP